ncbi:MAG: DNA repair protein RecO [Rickettsiales bacterium]|jgi:DNA repair protein RecO (recombination protein O)|nr:DNA repair protein RecO [Rickettsiales bacterium]
MKKNSDGILISVKKFGNADIIATFLTENFGVLSGLIKGGQSRKFKGIYQLGGVFNIEWMARLSDQLGTITANLIHQYCPFIIDKIVNLELLSCTCNMLVELSIGEEKSSEIYRDTMLLLKNFCDDNLSKKDICKVYFLYEKNLLSNLGFAFELEKCNVSGSREKSELKYISPTTAKAVSNMGAIGYEKKLFKMPEFFIIEKDASCIENLEFKYADDVLSYFFEKNLFVHKFSMNILTARNRLVKKIITKL